MINWKIRIKSKVFWLTAIPAVLLFVQTVAALIGVSFNGDILSEKLTAVINALFVLLTMVGIVSDPTTDGLKDSQRAMQYEAPNNKALIATYQDDRRDDVDK